MNSSEQSVTPTPCTCSQPIGHDALGRHQKPLICVKPYEPPCGSLTLWAVGVHRKVDGVVAGGDCGGQAGLGDGGLPHRRGWVHVP